MYIRSERFRDARTEWNKHGADMSLLDVAAESGVDKSFISRAENDDSCSLGADKVAKLARFYGVSTDYLLGLSDIPYQEDASLDSAVKTTGLSFHAFKNIIRIHKIASDEETAFLEYLFSSPALYSFINGVVYYKACIEKNRDSSEALIADVQDAAVNGLISKQNNRSNIDTVSIISKSINSYLWCIQSSLEDLLREYIDFDSCRQIAGDCRTKCEAIMSATLTKFRGDSDAE